MSSFITVLSSLAAGDYAPWWNTMGIAEDHWFIDLALTILGY